MNKIFKVFISILIAISMILNPFSPFAVHSSAYGALIGEIGYEIFMWVLTSIGVTVTTGLAHEVDEQLYERAKISYAEIEAPIESGLNPLVFESRYSQAEIDQYVELGYLAPGQIPVVASLDNSVALSDTQLEFYQAFVDSFNSSNVMAYQSSLGYDPVLSISDYTKIKNQVTNDFYNQCALDLAMALDNPVYSFDFVGPLPSMTVPTSEGFADLSVDGFKLTVPTSSMILLELNGNQQFYFPSEEAARAAGCNSVSKVYVDPETGVEYWSGSIKATAYGGGNYVLYNGEIYYRETSYRDYTSENYYSFGVTPSSFNTFVSVDGVALSDVYTGGSISMGVVLNTTNEVKAAVPTKSYSEEDFVTSVGGTVDIPRTDAEEIIGNGIELGLVNPDSTITFDESGNITAVDDIEIAKLEELIEKISAGNLELEDIQSYLDLITKLVSSGNMTATEQKIILDNIATLTEIQNKDISDIKNSVKSIADSITAEGAAEDVDSDFGYLQINHHGLIESQTIINTAFPFVAQSQQLINNLFDYSSNSTDIPNFSFYWDSNKDGIQERYTLLDLSFMEQVLTNDNLEDKNRFMKSMTIREFVQALIVFVIYVGFSVKFLRKLPGLFGSAESVSDNAIGKR